MPRAPRNLAAEVRRARLRARLRAVATLLLTGSTLVAISGCGSVRDHLRKYNTPGGIAMETPKEAVETPVSTSNPTLDSAVETAMAADLEKVAPAKAEKRAKSFDGYMDSRVGSFTYDDAIAEWGDPGQVTEGGRILLVTWGPAEARKAGGEFGNLFLERTVSPEENLNVVFDAETQQLASWGISKK